MLKETGPRTKECLATKKLRIFLVLLSTPCHPKYPSAEYVSYAVSSHYWISLSSINKQNCESCRGSLLLEVGLIIIPSLEWKLLSQPLQSLCNKRRRQYAFRQDKIPLKCLAIPGRSSSKRSKKVRAMTMNWPKQQFTSSLALYEMVQRHNLKCGLRTFLTLPVHCSSLVPSSTE